MEDAFMNRYFCDGREECIDGINHRIEWFIRTIQIKEL